LEVEFGGLSHSHDAVFFIIFDDEFGLSFEEEDCVREYEFAPSDLLIAGEQMLNQPRELLIESA
jgi:hypothetical protein